MVLLDTLGEKYACEQCIKGHRVTSCQHQDRPLRHVNKKGRPVSQCQHCRGLRKSRATHTRCSCGEPASSSESIATVSATGVTTGEHRCSCNNGGKCTCAVKKEANGSEEVLPKVSAHRRVPSKPHIANRRSEGNVPRIRSTMHPPLNRANNSAHESAWPYPMQPRTHPLARASYAMAQRSVDSLPLHSYISARGPVNTVVPQLHPEQDSPMTDQPTLPNIHEDAPQLDPINLHVDPANWHSQRWSTPEFPWQHNNLSTPHLQSFQPLHSADTERSNFNWYLDDSSRTMSHPNIAYAVQAPPSLESVDHSLPSHPGLSRSVSGTTSEIGDGATHFDNFHFDAGHKPSVYPPRPQYNHWASSDMADIDPNRLSVTSLQFFPQDGYSTFQHSPLDTHSDAHSPATPFTRPDRPELEMDFAFNPGHFSQQPALNSPSKDTSSPAYKPDFFADWDAGTGFDHTPKDPYHALESEYTNVNLEPLSFSRRTSVDHSSTVQSVAAVNSDW